MNRGGTTGLYSCFGQKDVRTDKEILDMTPGKLNRKVNTQQ